MVLRDKKTKINTEEKAIEINAEMQGTLSFGDPVNLRINGVFEGTLQTRGTLTIGDSAIVNAQIKGESVVIAGKVKGDVYAKIMLVLMPTAELIGNITTPKLNIVEGAIFQGKCQMLNESLTVDEVARYLDLDIPSVIEMASSGNIPANKDGDNWKFDRVKVDRWIVLEKAKG
jgi:excisionase family DNA binding protein